MIFGCVSANEASFFAFDLHENYPLKLLLTEAPTIIYFNFKFNFEGEARPKDRIQGGG